MFAKNTSPKIIGFGKFVLLPQESGELPAGFDENHPVVKEFHIDRGLIEKANPTETEDTGKVDIGGLNKKAAADKSKEQE